MSHECESCTFVADRESIFVSRESKKKASHKPTFFGVFTMTNWEGHASFYIFRCKECGEVSVDYPHGFINFGLIYLHCDECGENLPLEVSEEKDIYEREGMLIPLPTQKEREKEFMKMVEGKTGGRVIVIKEKRGWRELFKKFLS